MPELPNAQPPPSDRTPDPERTDLLLTSLNSPASGEDASVVSSADTGSPGDLVSTPPPALPRAVGRYQILNEIAQGGMGAILTAQDPELGRAAAIKILLPRHLAKPEYRERLIEEARITARLQHPGIVAVYDKGELPDTRPYFAMELVQGATLDSQLGARGTPAENLPFFIGAFEQVCQTLAYAHTHGIVHRDVKPLNVMIAPFGVVKLMDWGVACDQRRGDKPCASNTRLDGVTEVLGTPAYMAPEQAQGDHGRLDERTDVFGLGGILCAILTGKPPYPGTSLRKVFNQAKRADLAAAFARLDDSPGPPELVALAKSCLAPHRDARPRNARDVAGALTAYVESDLRRAERDLVRFFELSPDLFCIAGHDGYFRRVNGNFTRVLGHTPEELITRPFLEFVHPDDRQDTIAETQKLQRGLPVVQFRNRYRDHQGNYRWFEWEAKPIPEENVIFAVARDITARMELEARVKRGHP